MLGDATVTLQTSSSPHDVRCSVGVNNHIVLIASVQTLAVSDNSDAVSLAVADYLGIVCSSENLVSASTLSVRTLFIKNNSSYLRQP